MNTVPYSTRARLTQTHSHACSRPQLCLTEASASFCGAYTEPVPVHAAHIATSSSSVVSAQNLNQCPTLQLAAHLSSALELRTHTAARRGHDLPMDRPVALGSGSAHTLCKHATRYTKSLRPLLTRGLLQGKCFLQPKGES